MTGKSKLVLTKLKAFRRLSLLERLWLMAPIMIWFSYLPQISLAEDVTGTDLCCDIGNCRVAEGLAPPVGTEAIKVGLAG